MNKLFFLLSYITPLSCIASIASNGWGTYFAVVFHFICVPLFELLIPLEKADIFEPSSDSLLFDSLIFSMVPIQIFTVGFFCTQIATQTYSTHEYVGLILAMGISCGVVGINVAHELGHRKSKTSQLCAKLLLTTSLYTHFFIEHNRGHHRSVATDDDAASAKLNQNLYQFWIRSVVGNLKTAWRLESGKRLLSNQFIRWKFIELLMLTIIYMLFGALTLSLFILSAIVGILLLESVNYIEHYGLSRKVNESGRYEKVQVYHSWNSNHLLSRSVLFNLPRHSDHHANVNRKYESLQNSLSNTPQLPTGYPGMVLLSMIPYFWFKIMNPKVGSLGSGN